jgi:hypothetical protein
VRANDVQSRLSREFAYFYGPFGFLSSYLLVRQHVEPTGVGRPDHHPAGERLPTERSDEGARCSPEGCSAEQAACDTNAHIKIKTVTRGTCRRVRPIISCRFTMDTVSTAARRPASACGSITDFQRQITAVLIEVN